MEISPVLYELASSAQKKILNNLYDIKPFSIQTITLERIFIDKLFAAEAYVRKSKLKNKALPIHQRHELAITGKDLLAVLEETPGKWLGELIAEIEQHVVEGSLENKQEVLLSFAKKQRSKGEKA